ncbi:preprotein translocase subunit SecE [Frischella perrara]|jgi:preprotein translocase, SecE subunit, bacterial|uniref:Protein translocase subunit SecE n=1 Tax=Frischella perrara TaxID=1267021 RepID=A0A0A7S2T2_FRIPE|nr:preprotein translocase subunit SecE [Frischella perrara]AJA45799.1 preprotein translocase, SecE subunit, bacterial [Frischella perrara]MCT6876483.1 preprotein translocase subunit SecE [Frischella perrara]PWV57740.1 protein translocase subunit secE/sec61 gamma [Frischella perrara]PXY94595.1 preprotein translocase subunit SecE [Frischella perrara]
MRTNTNSEKTKANETLDKIKWTVVVLLVAFMVWGNFYFSEPNPIYQPNIVIRLVAVVAVFALAFVTMLTTEKGKAFIEFAKESRLELRKVVWPTRKETVQTTLLVAVITIVVGSCLWGLDTIFYWIISTLTVLGH